MHYLARRRTAKQGRVAFRVYRNHVAAKSYALAIGIAYDAGPFAFGLIFGPNFLGGLLPLDGADRVLHILTATLLAFGA